MFKKVAIGVPVVLAAKAVKPDAEPAAAKESAYECKPSELPLYTPLHLTNKTKEVHHPPIDSKLFQTIEGGIRTVRVEVSSGYKSLVNQKRNFEDIIATGLAHSQSTIDYLNEPDNTLPRVGAIAIGGVSGLLFAVRGGLLKKIIYTGIGAGGIASLCYPKEAEKFAQQGLVQTKKGVSIAYNFVKGVKPGDEIGVEPISNFPTSMSELKELFADLTESAKGVIFSSKK